MRFFDRRPPATSRPASSVLPEPEPDRTLLGWIGQRPPERYRRAAVVGSWNSPEVRHLVSLGSRADTFWVGRGSPDRPPGRPVLVPCGSAGPVPVSSGVVGYDLVVVLELISPVVRSLSAPGVMETVAALVPPGGTLLVILAPAAQEEGRPWPLTDEAVSAFATGDFRPAGNSTAGSGGYPWVIEYRRRPSAPGRRPGNPGR